MTRNWLNVNIAQFAKHRVIKNILALFVLQIANYIIPLLAWPLLAKVLGVGQFGVIVMIFAACTMANILTDFGFNLSATHTIATHNKDKQKIAQLLGNILALKILLAVLSCFLVNFYVYFEFLTNNQSGINFWTLVLIDFIIIAQACNCIWLFNGIEKMYYIAKANIISRIGYIFLLLLLLNISTNINTVLLCFLISQVCTSHLFFYYMHKEGYFIKPPRLSMLGQEAKYSFGFFISRAAVSIYTVANVMILGYFNNTSTVGLYSSAEKLYGAGNAFTSVVSQALFPYLTKTGNLKLLFNVILALILPVSLSIYIIGLFADEIMVLIFGESFRVAGEFLRLFLILLNVTFFSVFFGYPAFSAIKKVHIANYTVIIGALWHLLSLVALYFMNQITAKNLIYAIILTEFLVLVIRFGLLMWFGRSIFVKNFSL